MLFCKKMDEKLTYCEKSANIIETTAYQKKNVIVSMLGPHFQYY